MEKRIGILWFRQDLRLHDNEALTDALDHCEEVIPVYVFDERVFTGKTQKLGLAKTGKFRANFIIESIKDLRESVRKLGSELVVRTGRPEEEIFQLARQYKTSWVFCNRERTQEEVDVQDALEKKLWSIGQEMRYSRGKLLYYTADLPFPINHAPDVFSQYKKEVERVVQVRQPLPAPTALPAVDESVEPGQIPGLEDFGLENFTKDPRASYHFVGGETTALARIQEYFWLNGLASTFKDTRDGLLGSNFSTKFSPWLAQGCLSPKLIFKELKDYEARNGANKSTYSLFLEMLWRDFFRMMAKKHGNKIYQPGGLRESSNGELKDDMRLFGLWKDGQIGVPFIDANMREIALTGFMSNRGRQNVASYLVNDLKVNWQFGAEYFESILIDYDTASNWGNWINIAGVGNDPKEAHCFNILSQARKHDPKGEYVKLWLED